MPYQYLTASSPRSVQFNRTSWDNWTPDHIEDRRAITFEDTIDIYLNRSGTNTPYDPGMFERRKPYLVKRRIFLGYDYDTKVRRRKYWKNGEYFLKTERFTSRKKVFDTVYDVHYAEIILKEKPLYMKPNYLRLTMGLERLHPTSYLWKFLVTRTLFNASDDNEFTIITSVDGSSSGYLSSVWESGSVTPSPSRESGFIQAGYPPSAEMPTGFVPDPKYLDQCLIKLYEKVCSDTPNYYTLLAESGRTIDTIRSLAQKAASLALKVYRLQAKSILKDIKSLDPKSFSDAWLTWIYGISPVVSDLDDTVRIAMREDRAWRTFSASVDAGSESYDLGAASALDTTEAIVRDTKFVRYGVVIDGRMSMSRYVSRTAQWQQWGAVAYELTPFSFMLDWLVDISTYLNSLHVLDGVVKDSWFTKGRILYHSEVGKPKMVPPGPNQTLDTVIGTLTAASTLTYIRNQVFVERIPLAETPPMPKPIVPTSAQLFDGLSLGRQINALAVGVSQTFGVKDRWSDNLNRSSKKINLNFRGQ